MNNFPDNTTPFDTLPDDAFLRLKSLQGWEITPFSKATLWRKVKEGSFPSPIKLSDQITVWRVRDIRSWLRNPHCYKAIQKNESQLLKTDKRSANKSVGGDMGRGVHKLTDPTPTREVPPKTNPWNRYQPSHTNPDFEPIHLSKGEVPCK